MIQPLGWTYGKSCLRFKICVLCKGIKGQRITSVSDFWCGSSKMAAHLDDEINYSFSGDNGGLNVRVTFHNLGPQSS